MATRLNQLIALRKGVNSNAAAQTIQLARVVQKPALLTGIARSYRRINDLDPDLPSESTRVQVHAGHVLLELRDVLIRQFDVVAAVDWTNRVATADVVVDGQVLIPAVPVPYLLFLEKQLGEVRQFVTALPTLDPAERWSYDSVAAAWAAGPTTTTRTRKVMRNHVLAEASPQHPAQVTTYTEDEIAGYWDTMKFSGALPADRKAELLARTGELTAAVKFAREEANMAEAVDLKPASALFAWLLQS